jgi:hypothetical protein
MFDPSAAGTMRRALAQLDRHDLVAHLHDNFSFGPIDGNGDSRAPWVDATLGITNWDDIAASTAPFLDASCSPHLTPVAWFSRRDAHSYAGFLWWLERRGDEPCRVMDVTDLTVAYKGHAPYLAVSPSLLSPDQMIEIIDEHAPLEEAERTHYRAQWRVLAAENAALRVIDQQGSLVSAPIDHFDPLLMSCASTGWRKMAVIVRQALAKSREGDVSQAGDLIFHSRLCELAETGALEWRGDLDRMQQCELRLPV